MFRCRATGRPFVVRIPADANLLASRWRQTARVRCPHCGDHHAVTVSEAFIEQALELPPPGTAGASSQRPVQGSTGTGGGRNEPRVKGEGVTVHRERERELPTTISGAQAQDDIAPMTVVDAQQQPAQAMTGRRTKPVSRGKAAPPRS